MALKDRAYLKSKFETGDIPTEQDYIDFLDSYRNLTDDPDVKTWYLSTNGNDSNIGSIKVKPFENPQAALDAAASGDKIEILDIGYSKSGAFTFSKDVTIVGPAGYNSTNAANISGQFTITGGASLQFQNMHLGGVSIISIVGDTNISLYDSRLLLTAATANVVDLKLANCEFDTSAEITLRSLIMRAVEGSGSKLNTEGLCTIFFSNWSTDIEVGTGGASNCNLRGTTLGGDLTVTGNLGHENSTIKGALSVSGTTTGGSIFPGQVATVGKTLAFTATPEIDFNESNKQQMTLTGNITAFTTINEFSPVDCTVFLINDGSVRTVVAPTGWEPDSTSETHSTAANAINMYQFYTLPNFGTKFYNIHIVKS